LLGLPVLRLGAIGLLPLAVGVAKPGDGRSSGTLQPTNLVFINSPSSAGKWRRNNILTMAVDTERH